MGKGINRGLANLGEQVKKRGIVGKVSAQNQGVDKQTNQVFGFKLVAPGDRRADGNVALSTQPIKQSLEPSQ